MRSDHFYVSEIRGDMTPFIIGFDRLRKTVGDGQVQDGRAVAANAFDDVFRRPCLPAIWVKNNSGCSISNRRSLLSVRSTPTI